MAGRAKEVLAYAADKFGWTDNQAIATINWRAIERAKKRLDLSTSIRTTKFMYGWLNVGRQKGEMGGDHICPCCGTEARTNSIFTDAQKHKCKSAWLLTLHL